MCVCVCMYVYNVSIALLKFYSNNENLDINEDVLRSYFLFCRGMLGGCGISIQLGDQLGSENRHCTGKKTDKARLQRRVLL